MDNLILHLEGSTSRSDFPLDVFLWNVVDQKWEQQNVTDWGDVSLREGDAYLNASTAEIRLMLSENGNGGGSVDVSRADFSLVVKP